jgi:vanillate O-demethylase ferredoxin subunit
MAATNIEVWQKGHVIENVEVAEGIRQLTIRQSLPAKADAGSHIDLWLDVAGEKVRRSYSIVRQSNDLLDLTIAIFRVKNSRGGSIAMHQLQAGDELDITQPIQNFPLRFGAKKYVLLAGGIGVTALVSMADALKAANREYRFVYASRSRNAQAFGTELASLHNGRFENHIDDEGQGLDVEQLVAGIDHETELYMCGPIRLMDAVRREWLRRNLDISNLRFETFGASGWFEPEEFVVRVADLGVEVKVGKNESMLDALEGAGLEVMADCRKGECGLCELRVTSISGKLDSRDVFYSEAQKSEGKKIACCVSRIASDGQPAAIEVILNSFS